MCLAHHVNRERARVAKGTERIQRVYWHKQRGCVICTGQLSPLNVFSFLQLVAVQNARLFFHLYAKSNFLLFILQNNLKLLGMPLEVCNTYMTICERTPLLLKALLFFHTIIKSALCSYAITRMSYVTNCYPFPCEIKSTLRTIQNMLPK